MGLKTEFNVGLKTLYTHKASVLSDLVKGGRRKQSKRTSQCFFLKKLNCVGYFVLTIKPLLDVGDRRKLEYDSLNIYEEREN